MNKPPQAPILSNDAIALAAYLDWVSAGQPQGRDQEFWISAEARLKNGTIRSTAKAPRKSRKTPGTAR